jgi:hypothetical protein
MLTLGSLLAGVSMAYATCRLTRRGYFDLQHLMFWLLISGGVMSGAFWVNL